MAQSATAASSAATGARPVYEPRRTVPLAKQAAVYASRFRPSRLRPIAAGRVSFVIFAQGRTGSTLLADLMNSHEGVHCDNEILGWPVRFPDAWVDACRRRYRDRHYGFKVKPYELTVDQRLDPGAWLRRMDGRGWKLIHLRRNNVLRHALSNIVAEHIGRYTFRNADPGESAGLTVDPDVLLGAMEVREEQGEVERVALEGLPHVSLSYEDDLLRPERHQATLDRISDALGLPRAQARTALRRITIDDLRTTISNYEEVATAVRSTRWAPLLGE